MKTPVIDAVQTTLEPVIFTTNPGEEVSIVIAKGNIERVNTVVHTLRNELCKDHSCLAVNGSVAEVVLPCTPEGGVNHPVLGLHIKSCRCGNGGHIGAVTSFGHRVDAWGFQADGRWKPQFVVGFGAEVQDGCRKEAPLDAGLNLHRGVGDDQLLESCQVSTVIGFSTKLNGE